MHQLSQVDVFTDELMYGNPVAVVHDAADLADEQMAAFARWTNLSETTFLLTPTDPDADYRLRIFTRSGELPFAGHPTLGSARAWLVHNTPRRPGDLVQECGAGRVRVRVREDGGRLAFAAPPLRRSGPVSEADLDEVARALRIGRSDIVDAQWADNGPGWVAIMLANAEDVLAVEPGTFGAMDKIGLVGPHAPDHEADFEVRAFFGGWEDPVTGSLNAAIAQWLIGSGQAPASYVAAQDTWLQRRGRVHIEQVGDDIRVGGDTVVGISGTVLM